VDVERLDFSKPPPGWVPSGEGHVEEPNTPDSRARRRPIAAAWGHYKEELDPPGMRVQFFRRRSGGGDWTASDPIQLVWIKTTTHRDDGTEFEARAAAWQWYEQRLELANKLESLLICDRCGNDNPHTEMIDATTCTQPWCTECDQEMGGIGDFWPDILTWSNEQVAAVDLWLTDTTKAWPEVLCG
jgi:hypothetical protein